MYQVQARDAEGRIIDLGSTGFDNIDFARGFAVGAARTMLFVGRTDGEVHISSDGKPIEGATIGYWAQAGAAAHEIV